MEEIRGGGKVVEGGGSREGASCRKKFPRRKGEWKYGNEKHSRRRGSSYPVFFSLLRQEENLTFMLERGEDKLSEIIYVMHCEKRLKFMRSIY